MTRQVDIANYPVSSEFRIEAVVKAVTGAVEIRLFNITDGVEQPGSLVSTDSLSPILLKSGIIAMPVAGLSKLYRLEFGGSTSEEQVCFGGDITVDVPVP